MRLRYDEKYKEIEMGKVKSAFEIAMEKAGKIGGLSREEKEVLEAEEKVMSILREFYQGKLDSNGLWQRLKESNPNVLRVAQLSLVDTINLRSVEEEFQSRRQAIVAVETLKESPNTAVVESVMDTIADLFKEYSEMKGKVLEDLKRQIERYPQMRMMPVKSPDGRVMQMNLSVDEAVKARLPELLSEQEGQYSEEFIGLLDELKSQLE